MIGTFMAWLTDVGAGGGTSYLIPGKTKLRHFFPKTNSQLFHRFIYFLPS
jgi:hypothetical protein